MINKIRNYINKDIISYAHIDELLDRDFTIIYASDTGFIIKDNLVNFIYISFSDFEEMKKELSKKRYDHYLAYEKEIVDYYGDSGKTTNLIQYVYTSKEKFDIGDYDIRVLDESYEDRINSIYKALGPGESILNSLKEKKVIGLFIENKLAGFIGRHPEGCMGMLYVFEEYRGHKYGEILEKAMINKLLDENQKIIDEVIEGNTVSFKLQDKLGLVKGKKKIYWLL